MAIVGKWWSKVANKCCQKNVSQRLVDDNRKKTITESCDNCQEVVIGSCQVAVTIKMIVESWTTTAVEKRLLEVR